MVNLIPFLVFFGSTVVTVTTNTCNVSGVIYEDSDQFIVENGTACTLYACDQGNMVRLRYGCLHDGDCVYTGETFFVNCTRYECFYQSSPNTSYVVAVQANVCCSWEGRRDYEHGTMMAVPQGTYCQIKRCNERNWVNTERVCYVAGTCLDIGSKYYMNGCQHYICVNDSSGTPTNQFLEQHCQYGTECKPEGHAYYTAGCMQYICTKDELGNAQYMYAGPNCIFEDDCRPLGFVHYGIECQRRVCQETSNGILEFVLNLGSFCCVKNTLYEDGEIFTPIGESIRCVEMNCLNGVANYTKDECEHRYGCLAVGDSLESNCTTFSCRKDPIDPLSFRYEYIISVTRSRCRGYQGVCYDDGATNVVFMNPDGVLTPNCRCYAYSNGSTSTDCNYRGHYIDT